MAQIGMRPIVHSAVRGIATDPTCGMEVDEKEKSTLSAIVGGKKHYFCSNECRSSFLEKKG